MSHHGHSSDHTSSGSHGGHGKRLGDGSLVGEDFEEGLGHTMPVSTLNKVFASLIALTVITVVASRINLGSWNILIALGIATLKAAIVASFFMHLKFEGKTIMMYVFYPLIILFLFIGGSFVDVATRLDVHPLGVEDKVPQPVIAGGHEHGEHAEGAHQPPEASTSHAQGSGAHE